MFDMVYLVQAKCKDIWGHGNLIDEVDDTVVIDIW